MPAKAMTRLMTATMTIPTVGVRLPPGETAESVCPPRMKFKIV